MINIRLLDPNRSLPLSVESVGERATSGPDLLMSWCKENEQFLDEKLLEHGAILFRGFGINTPSAFARFVRSVSPVVLDCMEENVPRTRLTSGIYTSTEYPPEYLISMHSEYSYSHRWPGRLYFCCIIAPREGGETPIADNREILKRLDRSIVEQFARKRVKYLRNLHGGQGFGLSWQTAFQAADRAVVEEYCRETLVKFEWRDDNSLRLSQTLTGVITHPRTGEQVWFNQAPQFHPSDYPPEVCEFLVSQYKGKEEDLPQYVEFGDDTLIDDAVLSHIRETMQNQAVAFKWQEGDVMMLDNVLVSHGRMPFVGPRKILVAMS